MTLGSLSRTCCRTSTLLKAHEIRDTCLCVDDLDRAHDFYRDVLGLELFEQQAGRHLFWRCGQRMLLLFLAKGICEQAAISAQGPCPGESAGDL